MVDSGASRNFMDTDFAKKAKLHISVDPNQLTVDMANGEPLVCSGTTDKVDMTVKDYTARGLKFNVIPLGNYDAILGKPWLFDANPTIDWRKNQVSIET